MHSVETLSPTTLYRTPTCTDSWMSTARYLDKIRMIPAEPTDLSIRWDAWPLCPVTYKTVRVRPPHERADGCSHPRCSPSAGDTPFGMSIMTLSDGCDVPTMGSPFAALFVLILLICCCCGILGSILLCCKQSRKRHVEAAVAQSVSLPVGRHQAPRFVVT